MTLYLDTSVLFSIFIEERRSAAVVAQLARATGPILISDFAAGEFGAAISTAVRTRRVIEQEAIGALTGFDQWLGEGTKHVLISYDDTVMAAKLVRRFDLALFYPDALHVACCRRRGAVLMTGDRTQAAAARALGVDITYLP